MFTDLVESTNITTRLGDAKAMDLLRVHNSLTRNALREHGGREVKHTGDGFMASFTSASDSVNCAIAIQKDFYSYDNERPGITMQVRIGLSAGEPVEEEGDLFGSAVQLAARLCAHAEPSRILAAQVILDECEGKGLLFVDQGEISLKGFNHPVRLYEVNWR